MMGQNEGDGVLAQEAGKECPDGTAVEESSCVVDTNGEVASSTFASSLRLECANVRKQRAGDVLVRIVQWDTECRQSLSSDEVEW